MNIEISEIIENFPKRRPDANKGDFGHVLVMAGSVGYTGAAYLTSQAALLTGSGLVTLAAAKSIYDIMAAKLTEVMVRPFFETRDGSLSLMAEKDLLEFSEKCDSIAIGPGISQNKETYKLVRGVISKLKKRVVLDADGINALEANPALLKTTLTPAIITPHPGEMARLAGAEISQIQSSRKDIAIQFALEYNTHLVLKGRETVVASPDGRLYINTTGNAGMASGGTGDVLTGMIASFLGQGIEPFAACALGAYFHGAAGDLALKDKGALSLIATDILDRLPEVLKALA